MPYTKPINRPFIRMLKSNDVITHTALSRVTGLNPRTAKKRFENIDLLTIGDIKMLAKFGHIPKSEILQALGEEVW